MQAVIRVLLCGCAWPAQHNMAVHLAHSADIHVVGQLPFADNLALRAVELWPHVVVFNTDYMVGQVLPVVADLKARIAGCRTLMLVDPRKPGMLPPRRACGLDFLVNDARAELVAHTIRRLASGEHVVDPRLQVATLGFEKQVNTRELEVLGLAANGKRVAEVAQRLNLSNGTVRNYMSAAVTKTGARNLIDAVRILRKNGWLR